jgi:hypothetical protein
MDFNSTEINGTTYEYQAQNEGIDFGENEKHTLQDAIDYFHGDGRAAFLISSHTAFVTEGDEIHLHALPKQGEQCPEDAHSCLGQWDVDNFSTMLDGLRIINKGVEVDSTPQQIHETMADRMGSLDLGSGVDDPDDSDGYVPRIR